MQPNKEEKTMAKEETLRLLDENIKAKVMAGAKIPTGSEDAWRDIPNLITRLLTAIPPNLYDQLILDLQEYSNMICAVAPFVVKAAYTRDLPLQTMRMHLIDIMKTHRVPIVETKYWTIGVRWQRHVVEIFYNVRYDNKTVADPGICTSPCVDHVQ
jgi:hypothetical protein